MSESWALLSQLREKENLQYYFLSLTMCHGSLCASYLLNSWLSVTSSFSVSHVPKTLWLQHWPDTSEKGKDCNPVRVVCQNRNCTKQGWFSLVSLALNKVSFPALNRQRRLYTSLLQYGRETRTQTDLNSDKTKRGRSLICWRDGVESPGVC